MAENGRCFVFVEVPSGSASASDVCAEIERVIRRSKKIAPYIVGVNIEATDTQETSE
jgi:hypothetical protein